VSTLVTFIRVTSIYLSLNSNPPRALPATVCFARNWASLASYETEG